VAKLVVFRGDAVEHEVHIGNQTVKIGRDVRNDIVLDDKAVTRVHAEVTREGGRYFIADLNSRNGVWINKQRISGKTPLDLGVPVTIGAYELTLEDDVGTSDLSAVLPNPTVVSTAAIPVERSSASTSRGRAAAPPASGGSAAAAAARKPAVFWSAVGVGTLMLCLVTYVAVRRLTRPPAPPPQVAVVTPTPLPIDTPPTPVPATPVTQDIVAGYVEAAQFAIEDRDYQAASDDIDAALELDPTNPDLVARKKQVQDLMAAPPPPPAPRPPKAPTEPVVPEAPGIPRRANEPPAEYTARVGRVQQNYRAGMATLDQDDFATAITRFQAVDRDQKGYQNVETLLADAVARQKKAVDTAIGNGQENERAGQLVNAIRWYERAQRLDPNSAAAQEKLAALADRRTKQGLDAFNRAEVFRKRNDAARAIAAYQEAADLLPSTNEKKAEAQQWLEKLKQ
jgi:Inner membrane component of T3SS, cytoplasmic domain